MDFPDNVHNFNAELLLREGMDHLSHQAYDKALETFLRAASLAPNQSAVQFNLGVALAKLGRWTEAVAAYCEAIRLRPHDTAAHVNLGFIYYELGRDVEAQAEFERAKSLGGLAKSAAKMRL